MYKKICNILAKVIGIGGALFVSVFSLDAFSEPGTLSHKLSDFCMHLVPSLILLAIIIAAGKRPKSGGILLMTVGTILSVYLFKMNYTRLSHNTSIGTAIQLCLLLVAMIGLPFIVSGLLFLLSSTRQEKKQS